MRPRWAHAGETYRKTAVRSIQNVSNVVQRCSSLQLERIAHKFAFRVHPDAATDKDKAIGFDRLAKEIFLQK